ncbi:MAG: hypothetical protein ACRDRO_11600, partial [Pseudonocardiaceae bacterium]
MLHRQDGRLSLHKPLALLWIDSQRRWMETGRQRARASADLLEQGHDDPFGPAYVGHPHAVL